MTITALHHFPRTTLRWLAACLALAALPAAAQPRATLLDLINAYRAVPHSCQGATMGPVPPLAAHPALSRVQVTSGTLLAPAIARAGYAVAQAEAILVAGIADPAKVMASIERSYCKTLLNPLLTEMGARRSGASWLIVLAQPAPLSAAARLPPSRDTGLRVLEAVNHARASARHCGADAFEAAPPLAWNEELAGAALEHSADMAKKRYFSHTGKDGRMVGERALAAGYAWRRVGENIAVGQDSPADVVAGWLDSPGHCSNLMDPQFSEMGAGYAIYHGGENSRVYWTQVFADPTTPADPPR